MNVFLPAYYDFRVGRKSLLALWTNTLLGRRKSISLCLFKDPRQLVQLVTLVLRLYSPISLTLVGLWLSVIKQWIESGRRSPAPGFKEERPGFKGFSSSPRLIQFTIVESAVIANVCNLKRVPPGGISSSLCPVRAIFNKEYLALKDQTLNSWLSLNSFTTLSLGKVLPLVLEFIPLRLQLLMRDNSGLRPKGWCPTYLLILDLRNRMPSLLCSLATSSLADWIQLLNAIVEITPAAKIQVPFNLLEARAASRS